VIRGVVTSPPASAEKIARLRELLSILPEGDQRRVMKSLGKHSIADLDGLDLRQASLACQMAGSLAACQGRAAAKSKARE